MIIPTAFRITAHKLVDLQNISSTTTQAPSFALSNLNSTSAVSVTPSVSPSPVSETAIGKDNTTSPTSLSLSATIATHTSSSVDPLPPVLLSSSVFPDTSVSQTVKPSISSSLVSEAAIGKDNTISPTSLSSSATIATHTNNAVDPLPPVLPSSSVLPVTSASHTFASSAESTSAIASAIVSSPQSEPSDVSTRAALSVSHSAISVFSVQSSTSLQPKLSSVTPEPVSLSITPISPTQSSPIIKAPITTSVASSAPGFSTTSIATPSASMTASSSSKGATSHSQSDSSASSGLHSTSTSRPGPPPQAPESFTGGQSSATTSASISGPLESQSSSVSAPSKASAIASTTALGSHAGTQSTAPPSSAVVKAASASTLLPGSTPKISTITSTITPSPVSTFSKPVSIVVTNSANGKTVLSAPAVITSTSTSREPDGTLTTITYVIANPTGIFSDNNQTLGGSSFLRNHGAVAGVFLVIGIVVAALIVCISIFFRRRRNRNRRVQLRSSITWPRLIAEDTLQDPFEDPREPPPMRTTSMNDNGIHWGSRGITLLADEVRANPAPPSRAAPPWGEAQRAMGRTDIIPEPRTSPVTRYSGPFSDILDTQRPIPYPPLHPSVLSPPPPTSLAAPPFRVVPPIGLAITTTELVPLSRVNSVAPSTPSIYPATLPGNGNGDTDSFYEHEMALSPRKENADESDGLTIRAKDSVDNGHKKLSYEPLTPPYSNSSHTDSATPSPISEMPMAYSSILDEDVNSETFKGQLKKVLSRTLLDVRPREAANPVMIPLERRIS